ncbi:ArsR family transcriptional regulator [Streptomyces sp. NPDC051640]|uniref:ArsR family transcriptional regulator n=1 Tax=Streptomyces sp. NPDC051640 TaxID=3365664 RepID=UPI0037A32DF1
MPISACDRPMARAATTSDVFNAIAEPQRRQILVLLRAGERSVTELAQELGMVQPGASEAVFVALFEALHRHLYRPQPEC